MFFCQELNYHIIYLPVSVSFSGFLNLGVSEPPLMTLSVVESVCFVGALCTELEKRGVQCMFRLYRHFVWKLYTFCYFHTLTISQGSKHLCSRALQDSHKYKIQETIKISLLLFINIWHTYCNCKQLCSCCMRVFCSYTNQGLGASKVLFF